MLMETPGIFHLPRKLTAGGLRASGGPHASGPEGNMFHMLLVRVPMAEQDMSRWSLGNTGIPPPPPASQLGMSAP